MVSDTILFGGQMYGENGESIISNNSCKNRILNFLFIKRIETRQENSLIAFEGENSLENPQLSYISFFHPFDRKT